MKQPDKWSHSAIIFWQRCLQGATFFWTSIRRGEHFFSMWRGGKKTWHFPAKGCPKFHCYLLKKSKKTGYAWYIRKDIFNIYISETQIIIILWKYLQNMPESTYRIIESEAERLQLFPRIERHLGNHLGKRWWWDGTGDTACSRGSHSSISPLKNIVFLMKNCFQMFSPYLIFYNGTQKKWPAHIGELHNNAAHAPQIHAAGGSVQLGRWEWACARCTVWSSLSSSSTVAWTSRSTYTALTGRLTRTWSSHWCTSSSKVSTSDTVTSTRSWAALLPSSPMWVGHFLWVLL